MSAKITSSTRIQEFLRSSSNRDHYYFLIRLVVEQSQACERVTLLRRIIVPVGIESLCIILQAVQGNSNIDQTLNVVTLFRSFWYRVTVCKTTACNGLTGMRRRTTGSSAIVSTLLYSPLSYIMVRWAIVWTRDSQNPFAVSTRMHTNPDEGRPSITQNAVPLRNLHLWDAIFNPARAGLGRYMQQCN